MIVEGMLTHLSFGANGRMDTGKMLKTGLVLGVALIVVGCKSVTAPVEVSGFDYRKNHPITIEETPAVLDVPVTRHASDLDPGLVQAIRLYANGFKRRRVHVMNILVPSGSSHDAAAMRTARRITRVLKSEGISGGQIHRRPYRASTENDAAPIRLAYHRLSAKVDECGNWPDDLTSTANNGNWQNFGCAQQSNLAAMVDNPSDLLYPRGAGEIDTVRRTKDIDKYREGNSPRTDWKDDSGGTISEIQN